MEIGTQSSGIRGTQGIREGVSPHRPTMMGQTHPLPSLFFCRRRRHRHRTIRFVVQPLLSHLTFSLQDRFRKIASTMETPSSMHTHIQTAKQAVRSECHHYVRGCAFAHGACIFGSRMGVRSGSNPSSIPFRNRSGTQAREKKRRERHREGEIKRQSHVNSAREAGHFVVLFFLPEPVDLQDKNGPGTI